ncbi:MAG: 30S ribosomal protein S17e [Candidatus Woesearchaeota archaeon]|jgi:small subunit ribosomal protein S17e|nr:30S ribosomal protein S17e [archaeon]MDP6547773.1 30S ribosomal protein S17e [Candidatus Woesearchaeota archaeon]MDP7263728.1 30S ribosomal protein S17e [Candidatus Woesearchaeota archaeon]MDP7622785.1 30S ribosomal protein S17e [Candidatus Woesearchaeota archaeon]HJN56482.1 30S ribosomal protein S17e [Candidatus Woesearchaeota archaeon]|tara:strand:- start:19941 stop:20180 length:240 start_codon:yes stop_codon:yes gene_type:complete
MGRIKTLLVKRITKQLFSRHADEYSDDFSKNKEALKKHASISSPKITNVVAGYVTRLVKQSKEGKVKRKMVKEDISRFY